MNKQASDIVEKKVKRELEFKLSSAERQAKLEKLLELENDIDDKSRDVKVAQKKFKAATKELQAFRSQLRSQLKTNSEARTVTATELFNYSAGIVQIVHDGEVRAERTLEAHERQESLLEKPKKVSKVIVRKAAPAVQLAPRTN